MAKSEPSTEPTPEKVKAFFHTVLGLSSTYEGAKYAIRQLGKNNALALEQLERLNTATTAGNVAEFVSALQYLGALYRESATIAEAWK